MARYVEPEPDMPGLCKFFGMVEYATYPGGQVRWFSRREDAQKYIAKREKFELVRARKGQAVPA